jgi:8-oxo-dGTP pyrophosphatase MutT (NUDIX family)
VAHIHEKIDFTVAIFVVRDSKVLLIHHRQLDKWLPLGGHIELDEDPEQAALREAREESGLEVELDIHRITDTHEHIGLIYWARPKQGSLTLATAEHHHIRWCTAEDLEQLRPPMAEPVKWYCRKALQEIGTGSSALTEPEHRQPGQRR